MEAGIGQRSWLGGLLDWCHVTSELACHPTAGYINHIWQKSFGLFLFLLSAFEKGMNQNSWDAVGRSNGEGSVRRTGVREGWIEGEWTGVIRIMMERAPEVGPWASIRRLVGREVVIRGRGTDTEIWGILEDFDTTPTIDADGDTWMSNTDSQQWVRFLVNGRHVHFPIRDIFNPFTVTHLVDLWEILMS